MTTEMNQELKAALNGRKPVAWGRRISGNMNGVIIENHGKHQYIGGPFWSIRRGDQIAITRMG